MKTIESNTIDLIYCDILYGTGRKFTDYQDLKPIRSEIEAHYLPRLKEMHRVLKSTGSIYLQMDTRINHWMRILMDDVFGYDNFRNEIIWSYDWGNRTEKWNAKHDTILFYSKTNKYILTPEKVKRNIKDSTIKRMKYKGAMIKDNLTYPTCVWDIPTINGMAKERVGYATQKPKSLIERIIKASSNEGDTVADYYLGSGTTAVVCKELNRNFIGCDINPRAIEITLQRLNNARS
jgi:DNA modification methylase